MTHSSHQFPPQLMFLNHYWHTYRAQLHKCYGGRSDKTHVSVSILWRLHESDIKNAWLDLVKVFAEPRTFATVKTLTRLREIKRQRVLQSNGTMDGIDTVDRLSYVDNDQLDTFIDLAYNRLNRIQRQRFVFRRIHKVLDAIGLFTYNGYYDGSLLPEQAMMLACSGQITGQIGVDRKRIRRMMGIHKPQRIRRWPIDKAIKKLIHYFTGGRVFLWLSNIVYWRYWNGRE